MVFNEAVKCAKTVQRGREKLPKRHFSCYGASVNILHQNYHSTATAAATAQTRIDLVVENCAFFGVSE